MKDRTASPERPERLEITLPSGAVFPDWSVVASDNVRASLTDTLGVLRMTKRWAGLGIAEDELRRSILHRYAATGGAPRRGELVDLYRSTPSRIDAALLDLEQRDLVVLDSKDGSLQGAYPFSGRETVHRVRLDDTETGAMCAIDALGMGAMLNRDTVIASECGHCRRPINIETANRGMSIRSMMPETVVVWSGLGETDGCAADTHCRVMAFFCSDDHLDAWKAARDEPPLGHRLSPDEGLQVGAAIFRPFLAGPAQTDEIDENRK